MSSMADAALRLASSSRAALAARSRPSGSKPVTEEPPARLLGGFSGVITLERDSSLFFLPAPPNILYFIGFGLELLELGYCAGLQLFMRTAAVVVVHGPLLFVVVELVCGCGVKDFILHT